MLRVGRTGELGSGKSTVGRIFQELGATVLSSDEMARAKMQPGEPVYRAIVERFGPTVVLPDGSLDRPALARLAFDPEHPRVEELNAIVHPAVIAEQEHLLAEIAQQRPKTIVVVESALIFSTRHARGDNGAGRDAVGQNVAKKAGWQMRFDALVVVTAPEAVKIERFVQRAAGGRAPSPEETAGRRADALARLRAQRLPAELPADCLVIDNSGDHAALQQKAEAIFSILHRRLLMEG